jgi:hypothetical protein
MRTEQQIKRKLIELTMQRKALEERLAKTGSADKLEDPALQRQMEQLDAMSMMLEWVLDQPTGSYHS